METHFIRENNSYVGFNDHHGYNLTLGGEGMCGFKHDEKSKSKMSISAKGKKKPPRTKEHLLNLSLSLKGKSPSDACKMAQKNRCLGVPLSDNHRKSIGNSLGGCYEIESPNSEIFIIKNLNEFCRINNLNRGHMASVGRGLLQQHKGWKCRRLEP